MQIFSKRVREQDKQVCSDLKIIAEDLVKEKSGCQNQLDLLGILRHVLTIMESPSCLFPVGFVQILILILILILSTPFLSFYIYDNKTDSLSLSHLLMK